MALFEALVIDWLKIGTISEVSERRGSSWSAVCRSVRWRAAWRAGRRIFRTRSASTRRRFSADTSM
jgi:hypothetical protein